MAYQERKTYDYRGKYGDAYKVRFSVERYDVDGSLAVTMDCDSGGWWEPYATLTVNLGSPLAGDTSAFIDTNNMGQDVVRWLEEHGIAHATGEEAKSGYCTYPLMEFDEDFIKENASERYLRYVKPTGYWEEIPF